ncbi:MAG: hypothetical protein KGH49_00685 [Candidatus Micrarchaeota archaeon]|nr:hypothetical protein [Candidatus Micrarchaeota archaeon]
MAIRRKSLLEKAAHVFAHSRTGRFFEYVKIGWDNFNYIFYIGGISAILGGLFGLAGGFAVLLTIIFFYLAGRFMKELKNERERMAGRK